MQRPCTIGRRGREKGMNVPDCAALMNPEIRHLLQDRFHGVGKSVIHGFPIRKRGEKRFQERVSAKNR